MTEERKRRLIEEIARRLFRYAPNTITLRIRRAFLKRRIINPMTGKTITIWVQPSGREFAGEYARAIEETIEELTNELRECRLVRRGGYTWRSWTGFGGTGTWEEYECRIPKEEFIRRLAEKLEQRYIKLPRYSIERILEFFGIQFEE